MQIDWFTVAAQAFNFLVLAWLLKRFLYQPVIDAMAQREARIASRLEQAGQREQEAQAEARAYREKIAEIESDRQARLAQARDAAEQERRDLVDAARGEARASRERWQQDLKREQADFRDALVRELAEAAIEVARRAVADLADVQLEGQVLAKLAQQVQALPPEELQALADAAPRLQLATTFEPQAAALENLRGALAEALDQEVAIDCVRKPGLVFGAELLGAGHKLAWSLSGHLEEIADQIRESLDEARHAIHDATGPAHAAPGAPSDVAEGAAS